MTLVVGVRSAGHEAPAGAAPSLMVTDSFAGAEATSPTGNLGQPELPQDTTSI
jgi:hypothetical protein